MADNVGGILDLMQYELREPAETVALRNYIRDFLYDSRAKLFSFAEATATFSTVADQDTYTPGADGVPGNIMRIKRLDVIESDIRTPVEEVTIERLRNHQTSSLASSNRPSKWAWFANKIHFWPTPSAATTISLDYQIDPTLDKITGLPFDEASAAVTGGTFTNEFFTEGRALLTSYVLIRWGLGRGRDPELAQAQTAVYNKALSQLRQEYAIRKWGNGQVDCNL